MRSRSWVSTMLLALLVAGCFAQQSSAPEQESVTTLRASTQLVLLDIVVTDKQGKPVRNLSREDFTVLEDGAEQEIASFEPPGQHAPAPVEENARAAKGTGKKDGVPGPALSSSALTILVLDELDTGILDQAYARGEIQKFLRAHSPHLPEPTALMALKGKRLELLHDYTSDASALGDALRRHPAELPFRLMTAEGALGASERMGEALEALREIAAASSHFAGRKNVIWIGPGFPSLNYMIAQPSDKAMILGYVRETSDLIWQGRLAVYTIDPRGLEVVHENIGTNISESGFFAPPDSSTGELVFEQIAPQTGGRIFRGLNDLDAQIATSVDDGGSYCALSYYPSNRDWNGSFRKIRVLMRNPHLTARTRYGYYGSPDTSLSFEDLDRLLSRAVINPLSYHSLEVQAKARVSGMQPRTATITLDLDAAGLQWQMLPGKKHRCEVTVVAAGFSLKGEVVAHTLKELEVVVDEKKYVHLTKNPMVLTLVSELPLAVVRMRVVARDSSNGNIGTADLTPEGQQFH
jgi:VWFA-related protein